MKRMRLWLIPVVVLVLPMWVATAAGAAKPDCEDEPAHPSCKGDDPDPGDELVDVTMTLVSADGEGLTTNCVDGDGNTRSIEMIKSGTNRGANLSPAGEPVLGIYMDVEWWRVYEDPDFGFGGEGARFAGCHRMTLDPNQESIYGGLMISLDDSGAVTDLLWHFDYYYKWSTRRNGRPYLAVFEHFTLSGDETTFTWVDDTPNIEGDTYGTLTGSFGMSHHLEDFDNKKESIGYEPFPGSPRELSFTFVIEPRG